MRGCFCLEVAIGPLKYVRPVVFTHHQRGLEPGNLIWEVVRDVISPVDSAKESSHFHMHGSHF